MPEATFNNQRTATRTQRPASTAVRPDPPRPLRDYSLSFVARSGSLNGRLHLRRFVATSLRRFLPSASNVTLDKNRTSQTKPFASPTSIPVLRPAPYAFVKPGRVGKRGRATCLCAGAMVKRSAAMLCVRGHMPAPSAWAWHPTRTFFRAAFTLIPSFSLTGRKRPVAPNLCRSSCLGAFVVTHL